MKICVNKKCSQINPQSFDRFYKNKARKDGLQDSCKICNKLYRANNKEKICKVNKSWRSKNPEKVKKCIKRYHDKNKVRLLNYYKDYYKVNKVRKLLQMAENRAKPHYKLAMQKNAKARLQSDPIYREARRIRSRLRDFIRDRTNTCRDLGCGREEFKRYIEAKFHPGMTWDNYGYGKEKWTFDHIISLRLFDLTNPEEIKKASHFSNIQPLWLLENIIKR